MSAKGRSSGTGPGFAIKSYIPDKVKVGMSAKGRSSGTEPGFELIQDIISLGLCKISASQKSDIGLNALFITSSIPN